jgi:hypothetical protein
MQLGASILTLSPIAANVTNFAVPANITFGNAAQQWIPWTPTLTGGGSMTATTPTGVTANYLRIGPVIHFYAVFTTTLGGTPNNQFYFSLPVAASSGGTFMGSAMVFGLANVLQAYIQSGSAFVYNASAVYAAGSTTFYMSGTYQCAT